MKTNEEVERGEHERVWGRWQDFSLLQFGVLSPDASSSEPASLSVESYRRVSSVCSTCSGHVHREPSKPSETLRCTNTASLLCFLKRKCRLWQLRFFCEKVKGTLPSRRIQTSLYNHHVTEKMIQTSKNRESKQTKTCSQLNHEQTVLFTESNDANSVLSHKHIFEYWITTVLFSNYTCFVRILLRLKTCFCLIVFHVTDSSSLSHLGYFLFLMWQSVMERNVSSGGEPISINWLPPG